MEEWRVGLVGVCLNSNGRLSSNCVASDPEKILALLLSHFSDVSAVLPVLTRFFMYLPCHSHHFYDLILRYVCVGSSVLLLRNPRGIIIIFVVVVVVSGIDYLHEDLKYNYVSNFSSSSLSLSLCGS